MVVSAHRGTRAATGYRKIFDRLPAAVFRGEEQLARIRRPDETGDPAIQILGETGYLAIGALQHQQAPAIALVTWPELPAIRNIPAVGRIERTAVRAGVDRDLFG